MRVQQRITDIYCYLANAKKFNDFYILVVRVLHVETYAIVVLMRESEQCQAIYNLQVKSYKSYNAPN